jgi:hypothetical protein
MYKELWLRTPSKLGLLEAEKEKVNGWIWVRTAQTIELNIWVLLALKQAIILRNALILLYFSLFFCI